MLNDITYVKRPVGLPEDFPLNRFGFEVETSGFLQVQTHSREKDDYMTHVLSPPPKPSEICRWYMTMMIGGTHCTKCAIWASVGLDLDRSGPQSVACICQPV